MATLSSSANRQIIETTTTIVEYEQNIIYLRMKEGAEVNLENTLEQYAAQQQLTKDDYYGVLVDGRNFVIMDKESRKYMSTYFNPKRLATALLTQHNIAMQLLANVYMRIDRTAIETRMFDNEQKAVKWLREKLTAGKEPGIKKLHTNNHHT